MAPLTALIVDDEPLARDLLREMLSVDPDFAIVGECRSGAEAVDATLSRSPDLLFLDVQMPEMNGFEVVEAIGPETFTYRGLVEQIGAIIGKRRKIISVSPPLGLAVGRVTGKFVRDVIITRDEITGLMQGRLFVNCPPPPEAVTKLTEWAQSNRAWLGGHYASELGRRRDREHGYIENRPAGA